MDIQKISALIDLLNNSDLAEIEICEGETSIRLSRQSSVQAPVAPMIHHAHHQPPAHHHAPVPHAEPTSAPVKAAEISGHTVRSPMVGTIYLAPTPGAKEFVTVGQAVKAGDILCIVEAMKMMNQIEADKAGTIKSRLVDNGTPVEFDQPLFVIE